MISRPKKINSENIDIFFRFIYKVHTLCVHNLFVRNKLNSLIICFSLFKNLRAPRMQYGSLMTMNFKKFQFQFIIFFLALMRSWEDIGFCYDIFCFVYRHDFY